MSTTTVSSALTAEMWQPFVVVYGRETELAALADSESSVHVIAGDVGIGKTQVIDACRSALGGITSDIVTIRFVPGALQAALLEALASVVAEVAAEEADVARAGGMLVQAASRLAQTRANDMLKAVGQGVFGYLRNKVGDEAIDLLIGLGRELRGVADDELALRIKRASDPDVIEAVVELAGEVSTLAGQREVLLRFDNGERLDPADLGRLADVCTRLPTGLRICLGFQVSTADAQRHLDLLRLAGAQVQLLAPLPLPAVEQWVVGAGLPQGIAPGVLRMTSGYPLAISDAVVLLRSGASLTALQEMTPRDAMLSATRASLLRLSPQASAAALKLAPYMYPMQASRVTEILGLTREAWAVLRTELVTHLIFLGGDTPWFHETRRRILLEEMYTPAERLEAQHDALAQVAGQIDSSNASSGLLAEYALMARRLSALQSGSDLAAVGEFNRDELAIIGALVELTDKDSPVLSTEAVLGYAESRFAGTSGMLDALTRLAERGRVVTVTKDSASVTGLVIQSAEVFRYLAGLVSLDLGILPLPGIASTVFDLAVRPLLADFQLAQYGVGEPDLGELVGNLRHVDQENQRRANGVVTIRDPRGMVAQFRWGTISFYLVAFGPGDGAFSDEVVEAMRGISQELLGDALCTDFVLAFPEYKVPARLIPQTFERSLGDTFPPGRSPRELDSAPPTADEVEDNLRTRATVRAATFDLSSPRERLALGLRARSYGYAYSLDPDGHYLTTVRLRNADGVYALEPDGARMDEALFAYRLKVRLGLGPEVNVERINERFSVTAVKLLEPVGSVLEEFEQVVKRFNQFQTKPLVLLEQGALQEAFQDHLDTVERNASQIATRLGIDLPTANDVVFVIDPVTQQDGFVVGAWDRCQVFRIPTSARPRARVRILDEPMPAVARSWDDNGKRAAAYLAELFGEEFEDVTHWTSTTIRNAVSKALGYADGDVRLVLNQSDMP